jgi:hypothetical protein
LNTSKRCRLELAPARWLLPQLLALAVLAVVALLLSRLPAWLAVTGGIGAAVATALPLRRLLALNAIEIIEPDLLRCYTARSTEGEPDSLRGWRRLGPWVVLHAAAGGRLPLWLPGLTAEARQALLRTLARGRPAGGS